MSYTLRMLLTGLCLVALARGAKAEQADVVIDPGHGGSNNGSPGRGEVYEKQVTLALGKAVARELREAGLTVVLTRTRDEYVPIRARARVANALSPRCFVSIHTNASPDHARHGIETYLLAKDAIDIHARRAGQAAADDAEALVAEQRVLSTARASLRLATTVQKALLDDAPVSTDRGVRQASHDVLADAEVPSILVEAGFLDHPVEGRLLASPAGQAETAHRIAAGILAFVHERQQVPVVIAATPPIRLARALTPR